MPKLENENGARLVKPSERRRFVAPQTQDYMVKTNSGTLKISLEKGDTINTYEDGSLVLNEKWRFCITEGPKFLDDEVKH